MLFNFVKTMPTYAFFSSSVIFLLIVDSRLLGVFQLLATQKQHHSLLQALHGILFV